MPTYVNSQQNQIIFLRLVGNYEFTDTQSDRISVLMRLPTRIIISLRRE